MTKITDIHARIVFNSRGEETVEVEVYTRQSTGRASAPSGASKGTYEAVAFPKSVTDSLGVLEELKPKIVGLDVTAQEKIDNVLREVDGTQNFSKIGGSLAYAISLASLHAAANFFGIRIFEYLQKSDTYQLPIPLGNILGGGKHASTGASDIQEFLVFPRNARSFKEAVLSNIITHRNVRRILEKRNIAFYGGRNDEGAWTAPVSDIEGLEIVQEACDLTKDEIGIQMRMGLDMASSSFWDKESGVYVYRRTNRRLSREDQINYVLNLIDEYELAYVEDPLQEEDFEGFAKLTKEARDKCLICGDDLFVTNFKRLKQGIEIGACNALIVKPNQVGTITDTLKTVNLARENNYLLVVSHRSGETEDTHLADLAIAFNSVFIKTGVVGGERICKLNELIRLEELLGKKAHIARFNR